MARNMNTIFFFVFVFVCFTGFYVCLSVDLIMAITREGTKVAARSKILGIHSNVLASLIGNNRFPCSGNFDSNILTQRSAFLIGNNRFPILIFWIF